VFRDPRFPSLRRSRKQLFWIVECETYPKEDFEKKIVTKKRKASGHVEGKKLTADIVGQYEQSQGTVFVYFIIEW